MGDSESDAILSVFSKPLQSCSFSDKIQLVTKGRSEKLKDGEQSIELCM